jgi:triacylglycerol lipase
MNVLDPDQLVDEDNLTDWSGRPLAETRWVLELMRLAVDPVFMGAGVPRGDGRPVILIPGFGAGDQTLLVLASWLQRMGYRPQLCGFIANVDCSDRNADKVEAKLKAVAEKHGRRVALIGHSRGGHYVKALAVRRPDLVSHGISMGADLATMLEVSGTTMKAVGGIRAVVKATGHARSQECMSVRCDCRFSQDFFAPFPADQVRLTSIYSKGDGVVQWRPQIVPYADCVEVTGSHVGLIFNRKTYRVIGDALSKPEL